MSNTIRSMGISSKMIAEIRQLKKTGMANAVIAKKVGCATSTVWRYVNGEEYRSREKTKTEKVKDNNGKIEALEAVQDMLMRKMQRTTNTAEYMQLVRQYSTVQMKLEFHRNRAGGFGIGAQMPISIHISEGIRGNIN